MMKRQINEHTEKENKEMKEKNKLTPEELETVASAAGGDTVSGAEGSDQQPVNNLSAPDTLDRFIRRAKDKHYSLDHAIQQAKTLYSGSYSEDFIDSYIRVAWNTV